MAFISAQRLRVRSAEIWLRGVVVVVVVGWVVVGWWAGWRVVIIVAVDLVVCSSSLSRCWYF